MDWNAFYSGILPSTSFTGAAGLNAVSSGGQSITGGVLPPQSQTSETKSFTQLSAGTGLGGLLGTIGILGNDIAGNKEGADAIVQMGPQGVENAATGFIDAGSGLIARITIIVLGFIFVAVGLSMFKDKTIVLAAANPLTPP